MKNFKFLLLPVFILLMLQAYAGNDNNPKGARSAAMGSTGVTMSDVWSISHNQAGLAFLERPVVGFYYENRFILPELGLQSLAFIFPTKKTGVLGLNIAYFGNSKYNEAKVGLAYAKSFGKKLSAGIQLDYLNTRFTEEYGNKGVAVAEIGLRSEPIEHLYIGAHVFNPTRSQIASYNNEKVPTVFKLGMAYNFSDKVYLAAEAEKDLVNKTIYKAGIEYKLLETLYLRTGISSDPVSGSFGIGYVFKGLTADLAFSTHPVLGISPHVSLNFKF